MANGEDNAFEPGLPEGFSPESKVGLFVLAGLAILMISILMLGDIHFRPQDFYHVAFQSIEGITDKSPVKIYGVEVGTVKGIELEGDRARMTLALRKGIPVYKNARVRIRSTGIIGTKFIALDPGKPVPGEPEDNQRMRSGDTLTGQDTLSMDELLERVAQSLDDVTGGGTLGKNLNATMANLRSITDALNVALGQQRQSLVNIVKNVEDFSSHAKSVAAHLDEVLTQGKEEIKAAIRNLKETLDKSNTILGGLQRGEGVLGTLLTDKKSASEIKETVTNLKQTSESAKEVLARFTKVRAFWVVQVRRDVKGAVYRGDVGLRLEPRPGRFYEILGQNLGSDTSLKDSPLDYQRRNTITGLIGANWGPVSAAVGAIQSRAGVEGRYRPFQDTEIPVANRMELVAQGFDFGRNAVIKGKTFENPNYTAGARFQVNRWVKAGIQAEDIAETTSWHGVVNVSFEDRDVAYLLGFVSFAR